MTALQDDSPDAKMTAMPALRATSLRHVRPVPLAVPLRFPSRCLAPDAFVKRGVKDTSFDTWSTWESGAPDVAFEVLSPSDTPERWTFREKLGRYRALGVRELIIANLDAAPGRRLRAWDRIDGRLVERRVKDDRTPCVTLGVHVLIARVEEYAVGVRLAYDLECARPVLTAAEGERAATTRVAELERELRKKKRRK